MDEASRQRQKTRRKKRARLLKASEVAETASLPGSVDVETATNSASNDSDSAASGRAVLPDEAPHCNGRAAGSAATRPLSHARSEGSVASTGLSLLQAPGGATFVGRESIRLILKSDSASLFVATWNLAAKRPTNECLRRWLRPAACDADAPDVYAVSLQEVPTLDMCFQQDLLLQVEHVVGPRFVVLCWVRKFGQMLLVLLKRSLLPYCSEPEWQFVPSQSVPLPAKTKGAIAVAFKLFQSSFLLIGCHLSYGSIADRIRDYHKIYQTLQFSKFVLRNAQSAIASCDVVFWFGDMNFRVSDSRVVGSLAVVAPFVGEQLARKILSKDQLRNEMLAGNIFEKFHEANIVFPPTYKYKLDTDEYHMLRIPSYTASAHYVSVFSKALDIQDRILYRSNGKRNFGIRATRYDCIQANCLSDHKPVFACFAVPIITPQH